MQRTKEELKQLKKDPPRPIMDKLGLREVLDYIGVPYE